jgi:hypothetical protein
MANLEQLAPAVFHRKTAAHVKRPAAAPTGVFRPACYAERGMMIDLRRGVVLVACVSVGFVISAGPGLVARAAEPDQWVRSITEAASTAATTESAAQRRIGELEQRVKELEAERVAKQAGSKSAAAPGTARSEAQAPTGLSPSLDEQAPEQGRTSESAARAPALQPPNEADAREQLRFWAKQIRDGETSARRLSPEWNAAVKLLVRSERQLDPQNPWQEL